ncbi:UNVERIFIED_CONTAM: hypothetical protein FKN15_010874 [Acipenser sinensis]
MNGGTLDWMTRLPSPVRGSMGMNILLTVRPLSIALCSRRLQEEHGLLIHLGGRHDSCWSHRLHHGLDEGREGVLQEAPDPVPPGNVLRGGGWGFGAFHSFLPLF